DIWADTFTRGNVIAAGQVTRSPWLGEIEPALAVRGEIPRFVLPTVASPPPSPGCHRSRREGTQIAIWIRKTLRNRFSVPHSTSTQADQRAALRLARFSTRALSPASSSSRGVRSSASVSGVRSHCATLNGSADARRRLMMCSTSSRTRLPSNWNTGNRFFPWTYNAKMCLSFTLLLTPCRVIFHIFINAFVEYTGPMILPNGPPVLRGTMSTILEPSAAASLTFSRSAAGISASSRRTLSTISSARRLASRRGCSAVGEFMTRPPPEELSTMSTIVTPDNSIVNHVNYIFLSTAETPTFVQAPQPSGSYVYPSSATSEAMPVTVVSHFPSPLTPWT